MLEVQHIRNEFSEISKRLAKRGKSFEADLNLVLELDDERKHCQTELDQLLASMNTISAEIGDLFKAGKRSEADVLKAKTTEIKEQSKLLDAKLKDVITALTDVLTRIPNAPHGQVPNGKTPEENEVVLSHGVFPKLTYKLPHWDLCDKYDLIDFELGVKITGAGFRCIKVRAQDFKER
jgi:seryl-tRNA synthetase